MRWLLDTCLWKLCNRSPFMHHRYILWYTGGSVLFKRANKIVINKAPLSLWQLIFYNAQSRTSPCVNDLGIFVPEFSPKGLILSLVVYTIQCIIPYEVIGRISSFSSFSMCNTRIWFFYDYKHNNIFFHIYIMYFYNVWPKQISMYSCEFGWIKRVELNLMWFYFFLQLEWKKPDRDARGNWSSTSRRSSRATSSNRNSRTRRTSWPP